MVIHCKGKEGGQQEKKPREDVKKGEKNGGKTEGVVDDMKPEPSLMFLQLLPYVTL